jgi:hypothetical protein
MNMELRLGEPLYKCFHARHLVPRV